MNATMRLALLVPMVIMALAGCHRDEDGAGPAERLGKAVDNASATVTNSVKDATQEASRGLDRATEKVGKSVERAGEKIQDKAEKMKEDD